MVVKGRTRRDVDLSDGVDYIRHSFRSEKGAPLADYSHVMEVSECVWMRFGIR